jgi:ABC-type branched-subunit amino acid transport system ATPase component
MFVACLGTNAAGVGTLLAMIMVMFTTFVGTKAANFFA